MDRNELLTNIDLINEQIKKLEREIVILVGKRNAIKWELFKRID